MNPALRPTQPIVWINGWPAVGKQAVAQCLAQFLGQDRAIIIDDCEFTDQMKLTPESQMARPTNHANSGRARSLSVSDVNKTGQGQTNGNGYSNCKNGGDSSSGSGSSSSAVNDKASFVVRECVGGRLITAHDEMSLALRARQEACFRKYVLAIDDEASAPVVSTNSKAGILKAKPQSHHAAQSLQKQENHSPLTNMQKVIIFTDCRANNAAGAEGAWRYADAAKQANRPFIPIYVECMPEEHERRSQASDRIYSQPDGAPITGAEAARELQALANGRLFTFPQDELPGLFVDVTSQGTHSLVMDILSFINAVCEKRSGAVMQSVAAAVRKRPGCFYDEKR
ncbi:MAG: hypothetical protein STHCBS139747_003669 [Sporothrix thermara]